MVVEVPGRIAQPLDEQGAAGAGRAGDHFRGGERDAQRPVAVLQLPDAERHHRHPELALHHPPLHRGRELLQPAPLLFQLALSAPFRFLGGRLLARLQLGLLLRADGRELGLRLLLHLLEEGDGGGRDHEGVEMPVGIEEEVFEERAVRLAPAALVEERKPEQLVRLGAQRERFETPGLDQRGEQLRGLRVLAVLEGDARPVHRLDRGGQLSSFVPCPDLRPPPLGGLARLLRRRLPRVRLRQGERQREEERRDHRAPFA